MKSLGIAAVLVVAACSSAHQTPAARPASPAAQTRAPVAGRAEEGAEGGVAGGVSGGPLDLADQDVSPPPSDTPFVVTAQVLEAQRIAGERNIEPPAEAREQMERDGVARTVAVIKLCTTADGGVASVRIVKSSNYPAYDQAILDGVKEWRYRPYVINGRAVAVCTSATFIHAQP